MRRAEYPVLPAYKLKKLTTPPLLVGTIVHEVLGRWLRTRNENEAFPADRLASEAFRLFDHPPKEAPFWDDTYAGGVDSEVLARSAK